MWSEVEKAKGENRHELVLSGKDVSIRIQESGLDLSIFELKGLNFLAIHDTNLKELPDAIEKLSNLQSLVLHSNQIEAFNPKICHLDKLKLLDLSRNNVTGIPPQIDNLTSITSFNLTCNKIDSFPKLTNTVKLTVLNLSNNKLKEFPEICSKQLINLAELILSDNEIENIPSDVKNLPLKNLDLSGNQIKVIVPDLVLCSKLKTLNLKNNPISDRRLLKLINQCHTKQILDYVKAHSPKIISDNGQKKSKEESSSEDDDEEITSKHTITVSKTIEQPKIIVDESVKNVREFLVACIVTNVTFDEHTFKQFIKLQNRLHDTVCSKRNLATIATHDFKKLAPGDLEYTTLLPQNLEIHALNRSSTISGEALFNQLQTEANNLRKMKKRNTYSGIHEYLYLLVGKPKYPCLINNNIVISFPPITNSETTKIEITTNSMLFEVTCSQSLQKCKFVMDNLIKDFATLIGRTLDVTPVKTVDSQGNLKVLYPSKTDLNFEGGDIKVIRNGT